MATKDQNQETIQKKKRRSIWIPNVKSWVGFDQLHAQGLFIFKALSPFIKVQKPQRKETFQQAMQRLKLTEADLSERHKNFMRLAIFYFFIGLVITVYALALAWIGHFQGGAVAFALALVIYAFAFKQHFWAFQIKQRKLGCSLKEWFNSKLVDEL